MHPTRYLILSDIHANVAATQAKMRDRGYPARMITRLARGW